MALFALVDLKSWANPSMDSARDEELTRCVDAAAAWLKTVARWEIEQDEVTIYLDGHDAAGPHDNVLHVPFKYRPVVHSGETLVTVEEDGSALTVGVGYDTSADVIVVNANEAEQCELVKPSSPWSRGYQNVKAVITAGYAAASIPEDVKQLAMEVSLLMFRSPAWIGKASQTAQAGTVTFQKDLTPQSAALLQRLMEG